MGTALYEAGYDSQPSFKVYPNPANEFFFVETAVAGENLRITDMQGRLVYDNIVKSETTHLSIANCLAGIYNLYYDHPGLKAMIHKSFVILIC